MYIIQIIQLESLGILSCIVLFYSMAIYNYSLNFKPFNIVKNSII